MKSAILMIMIGIADFGINLQLSHRQKLYCSEKPAVCDLSGVQPEQLL